MFIPDKS